jgi:integrase
LFCRDGVYYADGRGGQYKLGKHSLGTRDREQALQRLKLLDRQKAVELGLADARVLKAADEISIADGWKLYLDYCGRAGVLGGVSPSTLKRYRAVSDKHQTHCARQGITTWNEFQRSPLEKYGNGLAKQHADRTVYFELTLLKSVNAWLIGQKKLPPEAKIEYPLEKPQGTDTYCYRTVEVDAILAHCLADPKLLWLGWVVLALVHTGMRIGELAALRWSDVDLDHNVLRIADERSSRRKQRTGSARTTKGRRSRTVPIHPRLKTLLVGMERGSDGRVFHAPRGGRLRPNNVLHAFIDEVIQPLAEQFPTPAGEIGFEHGRLHSFRHYFCSQAFLGGASEGEIREWLGHRDSKMVEHYRHLRNEDAQRKMQQIHFTGREDCETPPARSA